MKCYICSNTSLIPFLDLGDQPPSDAFVHKEDLSKPEARFPLGLYFCKTCSLVQLGYAVDPNVLFKEYVYTSGTNNSLKKNFHELVEKIIERFKLTPDDLAVDVGSNDGTLLENYIPHHIKILGIDPSSVAESARQRGLPTIVDFFSKESAEKAREEFGRARVITANNVFAHVDALDSFLSGINELLTEDGVFVSESHYLLDIVEKLQYDSIYHEHLRYYSLHSLSILFARFDLEIFDVERISTHNGSIRVYTAHPGKEKISPRVGELLEREKQFGVENIDLLRSFADRVNEHRHKLEETLHELKSAGNKIVGIGAPAKGNTLLNSCNLGTDKIEYLTEKSALKIGLYTPGQHIPVVAEEKLFEDQPEYALILSWNITEELIVKLRSQGYRGKFIVPFPEIKIIA